jgi:exodeoxyribonuclease-3
VGNFYKRFSTLSGFERSSNTISFFSFMKIISWNVNGIRAVERKGALDEFLQTHDPDIFLLQEIKAKDNQLSKELREHPEYHQFYHPAEKPGYAGTGIWIKKKRTRRGSLYNRYARL